MDLKEIGAVLQSRRQELGLTLEDIQKVTKIRIRYLRAIEAGDDSVLPATAYAQGFIRSYANHLGLDGQELAKAYRQFRQKSRGEGETPAPPLPQGAKATLLGGAGRSRRSAPALPRSGGGAAARPIPGRGIGSLLVGILVVAAMIVGTAYVISTVRGQTEIRPDTETVQQDPGREQGTDNGAAGNREAQEDNGPAGEGAEDDIDAGAGDPLDPDPADEAGLQGRVTLVEEGSRDIIYAVDAPHLEIEMVASDRSWAEVWVDDEKVYEWFFEPGETRTYEGSWEIRLWAGNPAGVEITANGQALGAYDASGPRNLIFRIQDEAVPDQHMQNQD
ncbi:MAG TPA: RodZ domain-containing protein [Sphingobacteriaceae bacterium]|nr:RodZ domain-containing protein [Sphingobacteriaceae bacterium]